MAFALAACDGGEAVERGAPSLPPGDPVATIDSSRPAGGPGVIVSNVIQACREKDAARLMSFVTGDIDAQQVVDMFARGVDVQLQTQTIARKDEGTATVDVGLKVRRDGSTEQVRRTWQLMQGDDGVWRFAALPDCY